MFTAPGSSLADVDEARLALMRLLRDHDEEVPEACSLGMLVRLVVDMVATLDAEVEFYRDPEREE